MDGRYVAPLLAALIILIVAFLFGCSGENTVHTTPPRAAPLSYCAPIGWADVDQGQDLNLYRCSEGPLKGCILVQQEAFVLHQGWGHTALRCPARTNLQYE